jgi:hypothetical protein
MTLTPRGVLICRLRRRESPPLRAELGQHPSLAAGRLLPEPYGLMEVMVTDTALKVVLYRMILDIPSFW